MLIIHGWEGKSAKMFNKIPPFTLSLFNLLFSNSNRKKGIGRIEVLYAHPLVLNIKDNI